MGKWFSRNFKTIIYISFLVPIITVAIVSISHVTQWYGISNPLSWAVYLSIGIEIAALSALAAISAQMGSKVYFPFGIVTLIQFVGNIFFAFEYIKIDSQQFLSWVELTGPILEYTGIEQGDLQSHRRFLAIFAGGMLPLISLSFLHMLVKFNEENRKVVSSNSPINENIVDSDDKPSNITDDEINEVIDEYRKEKEVQEPIQASDLIAEISRFRPSEEDLKELENLLNKFKPEEPKKRITKEEQRELLTQMMRESEEMGLYDEPFNNPLIKDYKTPQNASEMMISSDEDIINSIPSDEEISDLDLTHEPPSWMDEIPEPTEEDYKDWDVTLEDGLEDEVWDEDHGLDQVLNDMVEDLPEEEIIETTEEIRKIEVVLDELPTPNIDFGVNVMVTTPEPTKRPANRYEQLEEYLNQTRTWGQEEEVGQLPDKVETAVLDIEDGTISLTNTEETTPETVTMEPTPTVNPGFVFRQPIQDQEDPEKKN
jgi:hypothetical protein